MNPLHVARKYFTYANDVVEVDKKCVTSYFITLSRAYESRCES